MRILTAFFALVLLALAITTKVQTVAAGNYSLTAFNGTSSLGDAPNCYLCEMSTDETFAICRCEDDNGDLGIYKFTTTATNVTAAATTVAAPIGSPFAIYNGNAKKVIFYDGSTLQVYNSNLENPTNITTSGEIGRYAAIVVDTDAGKAYITDAVYSVGEGNSLGPKVYTITGLAGTPASEAVGTEITATEARDARDLILVGSNLFVQVENSETSAPGLARLTTSGSSLTYDTTVFATSGYRYNGRSLAASSTTLYMSDNSGNKIHRWTISPFAYVDAIAADGARQAQLMWSPDEKIFILCSDRFNTLTMVDPANNLTIVGNQPDLGEKSSCQAIMTLSKSQEKIAIFTTAETVLFFDYAGPNSNNAAGKMSTFSAVAALSFLVSAFLAVM